MGDDVTDFRYGLTAVGEFCLCGERFSFQVLHAVFCESGLSGPGDLRSCQGETGNSVVENPADRNQ